MAHLIDLSNSRANVAFVGQPLWHGLGQKLSKNSPLEVWMKEAGMEWEAKKSQGYFYDEEGQIITSDKFHIFRNDTKAELGVCNEGYKIVQPREVIEFYRDLVESQNWDLEVAGCLDGGRKIWALAKTDGVINVAGTNDMLETYLLLATSFDGSLATIGKFTSIRVCCNNTLTMALNAKGDTDISVRHNTTFNAEKVKTQLGLYGEVTSNMETYVNALAKERIDKVTAYEFITKILTGKELDQELKTRGQNIVNNVIALYDGAGRGSNLPTARNTLWGAVNAITQYYDHEVNARSVNNRLRSAWFAEGDKKKTLAYNEAIKMLHAA